MSVLIVLTAPDGDDVMEVCSSSEWVAFGKWVEALEYDKLRQLYVDGETKDTFTLVEQLKEALAVHPPSSEVREVAEELLAYILTGDEEEVAEVVS